MQVIRSLIDILRHRNSEGSPQQYINNMFPQKILHYGSKYTSLQGL